MAIIGNRHLRFIVTLLGIGACQLALARGASPYLPLGTSFARERDFERVLVLAGSPVVRRPIPAAVVLDALPFACSLDLGLCDRVSSYLYAYKASVNVTQATVEADVAAGDADQAIPNSHGRTLQSHGALTVAAHFQLNDHVILTAGGIASEHVSKPTGTGASLGFDFAQIDVGYRDHWLSPSSLSSLLISTEAPTMPSITVSNYQPLTRLGITYELFSARMSNQNGISYFNTTTSGNPNLAGIQLGIEPVAGYGLTLNRLMQYGGGARGGISFARLRQAFFDSNSVAINLPDGTLGNQEFGNQIASVAGVMQFPGRVPFSVSMEYAGEDNAYAGNFRLGDTALSLALDLPLLWRRYDFRYEVSEWQNAWYTHHLYPLGMTNDGFVLGHWFGDQRKSGDQVRGLSNVLQLGIRTDAGGYWQTTWRTLLFKDSVGFGFHGPGAVAYSHLQELSLNYSTWWREHPVAGNVTLGRDAFGRKYGRVGLSVDLATGRGFADRPDAEERAGFQEKQVEYFVDVGANRGKVYQIVSARFQPAWTTNRSDYHLAVGARREVGRRSSVGVRLELDRVDTRSLLSLRAVDYQFRLTRHIVPGAFFGVGRYDYGAPAYGWYGGVGVRFKDVLPKWDIGLDFRRYDKLTRNRVLATDPPDTGELPRMHFDVKGQSLYFSRRF